MAEKAVYDREVAYWVNEQTEIDQEAQRAKGVKEASNKTRKRIEEQLSKLDSEL